MNFLAHIYLSGTDRELLIGNFIADFVKGKNKNSYPDRIREGIEHHRAIDYFTDHHSITLESKKRLYGRHHKYSGVIVDLFYDHFLAKNFSDYSSKQLTDFVKESYDIILTYHAFLPQKVIEFLPIMIERNWLLNYSTIEGIGKTLTGLGKRVAFENKMHEATIDLKQEYHNFESEFKLFFPQLINFAESNR